MPLVQPERTARVLGVHRERSLCHAPLAEEPEVPGDQRAGDASAPPFADREDSLRVAPAAAHRRVLILVDVAEDAADDVVARPGGLPAAGLTGGGRVEQ